MSVNINILLGCEIVDKSGLSPIREGILFEAEENFVSGFQQQALSDTEEALEIGDIETVNGLFIKAESNGVEVDLNYTEDTFRASLSIPEGESQFVRPAGDVYIKNAVSSEVATIRFFAFGDF